jgi:hypothetical protein
MCRHDECSPRPLATSSDEPAYRHKLQEADGFFTCTKKAFETLSEKNSRRLFDSVNVPEGYDDIPKETKDADKFWKDYPKAFARNSRWLTKDSPPVGDADSPEDEVGFCDCISLRQTHLFYFLSLEFNHHHNHPPQQMRAHALTSYYSAGQCVVRDVVLGRNVARVWLPRTAAG